MRLFTGPSCGCSLKSKLKKRPSSMSCCSIKSNLIIKRSSFSCGTRSFKSTPTFKKQSSGKKLFKRFRFKKRISLGRPRFRRNRPRVSNGRNPIRRFLALFRRKNRPPVPATVRKRTINGKRFRLLSAVLCRRRKSLPTHHHQTSSEEEGDEVGELRSAACETGEKDRMLFPSPLTPAYVRNSGVNKRDITGSGCGSNDVDEACRSFESHLVEMIIEEGKMCDLTDVEELLYCWNKLENPVFIGLVSRFYGELCKDLFLSDDIQDEEEEEEDREQNDSTIQDFDSSCNQ